MSNHSTAAIGDAMESVVTDLAQSAQEAHEERNRRLADEHDLTILSFGELLSAHEAHQMHGQCQLCELLGDDCHDLIVAEGRKRDEQHEEQERIREYQRRLDRSNLSKRNRQQTFSAFDPTLNDHDNSDALAKCQKFAERWEPESGQGLLIVGQAGTGKGHLCAAICMGVMERGYQAYKYKIPKLLSECRSSFDRPDELIDYLKKVSLLWFDELAFDSIGSDYESHKAFEILYEILDSRYENMKSTLITTNLANYDESKGEWDYGPLSAQLHNIDENDRLIDRLREDMHPIELSGPSVRPKLRKPAPWENADV